MTYDNTSKNKDKIASDLLNWFDNHGRSLPWRAKKEQVKNPYTIWLSEIMLQQTTVATVQSYFQKFITKWPTIEDLAMSCLDQILHAWAGLGYYSRARNLHKCAQQILHDYQGRFPKTEKELLNLPGIGPYTAAAIMAIAFDQQATIVDGNVERVISRLYKITQPLPTSKPIIKKYASALTPLKRAGNYAEAIMDLGATICKPQNPLCDQCPLQTYCIAYHEKCQETLPAKLKKEKRPTRQATLFWIESQGKIMLRKRPDKGLLGGLWELPSTPWCTQKYKAYAKSPDILAHSPIKADYQKIDGMITHVFTHFRLEMTIIKTELDEPLTPYHWADLKNLHQYALPTLITKAIDFKIKNARHIQV